MQISMTLMTVSESSALPPPPVAMVGTPIRAYVSVRQVVPSPMGDSIRAFTFECVLNVNIASVDSTHNPDFKLSLSNQIHIKVGFLY